MYTPTHTPRPPRLASYFDSRPLFFITFNTWERVPALANDAVHKSFKHYCMTGVTLGRVEVGRYVIMPDHVHLFVRGDDDFKVGMWIRGLRRSIRDAVTDTPANFWQHGFFDHVLRSHESYVEKREYVWLNPVRKGLVSTAEEWPFQGEICPIVRL